ncbi:MAG TPA: hypothetical protein VHW02_14315 [Rhizomicrobium sp.]|nr:hypothetical protein [Rhizomicrobium sp.]
MPGDGHDLSKAAQPSAGRLLRKPLSYMALAFVHFMFYSLQMQNAFAFAPMIDLLDVRDRLVRAFGPVRDEPRFDPMSQLVYSAIAGRTRDADSIKAFDRLIGRYPTWDLLADAPAKAIEAAIAKVTYCESKAPHLREALQVLRRETGNFDLEFLRAWPVPAAMTWLERLKGVGPKVAAAVLNFSTLKKRAFVIDTHGLRLLRRIGFASPHTGAGVLQARVLSALPQFDAEDFYELHWLLKRLGQTLCTYGERHCRTCPLKDICMKRLEADAPRPYNSRPPAPAATKTYPHGGYMHF